jgi:hypothetical protein
MFDRARFSELLRSVSFFLNKNIDVVLCFRGSIIQETNSNLRTKSVNIKAFYNVCQWAAGVLGNES